MPTPEELRKRYDEMEGREEAAQDAELPTLARQRETEATSAAQAVFDAARHLIATGMLKAAGYRILVKPIEVIRELEAAEAAKFPTLADAGLEVKTLREAEREDRGENHGIVIDIGPVAYERHGGADKWCAVGDTVVFARYGGIRVEHPPGSKVFYQALNDEDIYLVIK